jgi:hypothetical protein
MTVMATGLSRPRRKGWFFMPRKRPEITLVSASQARLKQGRPRNEKPALFVQSGLLKPEWLRDEFRHQKEGPMLLIVLGVKDLSR